MAYVRHEVHTLISEGYKWTDLRNDASDFFKLFIICFIACCFCLFVIASNLSIFIVSRISALIFRTAKDRLKTSFIK